MRKWIITAAIVLAIMLAYGLVQLTGLRFETSVSSPSPVLVSP